MQDSQRETGISATKILVSEPSKIPTGFSAGSRTPAAKISAGIFAKFPLGFWARREIPAAKISAGSRWQSRQDPAGIHGGERKLSGQNRGRTRRESRWDPAGIHGGERKSWRPKSRQDPAGIPVGSRQDPGKIPVAFLQARGRVTRNNNLCYPSRPCRYKTLMFGISSAAEKYQKVISDVIRSCSGVVNIADDLIVHGSDLAEHDWNLHAVLQRLRESRLSLNGEKCRLTFFGHDLSSEGVVPSEEDCCSCECS